MSLFILIVLSSVLSCLVLSCLVLAWLCLACLVLSCLVVVLFCLALYLSCYYLAILVTVCLLLFMWLAGSSAKFCGRAWTKFRCRVALLIFLTSSDWFFLSLFLPSRSFFRIFERFFISRSAYSCLIVCCVLSPWRVVWTVKIDVSSLKFWILHRLCFIKLTPQP